MSILYVFAGNNGSGKSTYRSIIKDKINTDVDLDFDSILRSNQHKGLEVAVRHSTRHLNKEFNRCIENRNIFSIETTLSGRTFSDKIRQAKENGYRVIMYCLYLNHVDLNLLRIKFRVAKGGHDIPEEDVRRRDVRTLQNLISLASSIDELYIVNTSGKEGIEMAYISSGLLVRQNPNAPEWVYKLITDR